jgi:hypothetical protein
VSGVSPEGQLRLMIRLCVAMTAFLLLSVSLQPAAAQQQKKQAVAGSCGSASKCLSLGLFYFNNDDISDKAAQQFRTVITGYPRSPEAEKAQFYLGSYYHRKFYIQRQRYRRDDSKLLQLAQREYLGYIKKYSTQGTGEWLADAHFNAALTYIQLGTASGAKNILDRMASVTTRDPKVYVYQVVWSLNRSDVVDEYIEAGALANYAQTLLGRPADQVVFELKKWCQSRKSRRLAK